MIPLRTRFLPLGLLAAAMLAALAVPATQARPGKKAPRAASPFAQQLAALHATGALIHQANHDYKGHRVAAIHQIRQAIHALHPNHGKHHAKGKGKGKGKGSGGGNENQAVSDAQLRQAILQLAAVQAQLNAAPGVPAAQAATHIQKAINELKIALMIN